MDELIAYADSKIDAYAHIHKPKDSLANAYKFATN